MWVGMEAIGSLALHIGHGASSVWRQPATMIAELEGMSCFRVVEHKEATDHSR
jgi:hypothetical protein